MPDCLIHDTGVLDVIRSNIDIPAGFKIRLYTNNYTPLRGDSIGSYTEATYPGYTEFTWGTTPIALDGSSHGAVTPATAVFNAPSSGSPVNVYGFYVVYDDLSGPTPQAFMGARFAGAPLVLSVGDPDLTFNVFLSDQDATL